MRLRMRLEFKLQDLWIGLFWKRKYYFDVMRTDYWICVVPCFPLHLIIERRQR